LSGRGDLHQLSGEERMTLMRFVCSFAWADDFIHESERALVGRYVEQLELDAEEARQVRAWLERPPPSESVDPSQVPAEHRSRFVFAIESIIAADGEIAAVERERLLALARRFR
jgi:uncharacterized tellurite resistance protein B-like protein